MSINIAGKNTKMRQRTGDTLNSVLAALFVGCTTFVVGIVIAIITYHYFPETASAAYADDLIIGTAAGLLVFQYDRRRNRYLQERLRIIEEMNHHVRNALEVISCSAYLQPNEELRTVLRDSSERIDWALREILPGKMSA